MNVFDDSRLWHRRLDYLNFSSLKLLHQKYMVQRLLFLQEMRDARMCSWKTLMTIIFKRSSSLESQECNGVGAHQYLCLMSTLSYS